MKHRIELSLSGRASCRSCGTKIAKGILRLGEAYPSEFSSDGFAIRWHHLECAAKKIPAVLREALKSYDGEVPERAELDAILNAASSASGKKKAKKKGSGELPTADLAPTGRAKCIQCGEAIAKGSVRVAVEREIDTGTFTTKGAGYLHPQCAEAWAEQSWDEGFDALVAGVQASTSLESLPAPFDAPPAKAKGAKKRASKKSPANKAKSLPRFGSLSAKKVESIVAKLAKLKPGDAYKAPNILEKAGLGWGEHGPFCWYLAQHRLLPPTHATIFGELADSVWSVDAEAVFAVVPRLAVKNHYLLMPGWSQYADTIVWRAQELDSARLEKVLEGAKVALRLGIQLVRGRCGVSVDDADRSAILEGLATVEASAYGLPRSSGVNGTRLHLEGGPYAAATDLTCLFGTEAEWTSALAKTTKAAKFQTLQYVSPGLAALPLDEFVKALGKAQLDSSKKLPAQLAALVELRADDPVALANEAWKLSKGRAQYMRQDLLLLAMGRMEPGTVPEGLEDEVDWGRFISYATPWSGGQVEGAAYRRALEVLGAARTHALATPMLEQAWGQSNILPLMSVHYDESLVARLFALPDAINYGRIFGPLGMRVMPQLLAALETRPKAKRRKVLEQGVRAVLGFVGRSGETFGEEYDRHLTCLSGEPYWQTEERAIFLDALSGMPDARRVAVLERLFEETKQIERPFLGVSKVEDAGFRERAARRIVQGFGKVHDRQTLKTGLEALGPKGIELFRPALLEGAPDTKIFAELRACFDEKTVDKIQKKSGAVEEKPFARLVRLASERANQAAQRIYLLERRDIDPSVPAPRSGSWSRSRAKGGDGELDNVITLDLEEIPELASRFPNARALELVGTDLEGGEDWECAQLRPLGADAAAPAGGNRISVVPVDVPSAIFDYDECQNDPVLGELRRLVFNRPGYVLGEPMFIQEDYGGEGFVMQLSEDIGDINLGDSGSLYVFEHSVYMQCY